MTDWSCIKNFKKDEFNCKHTGRNEMQQEFMERLDELRDLCGFPFVITSGYRDPSHPDEAKKATKGGTHTLGCAADIRVEGGSQRRDLVAKALKLGFAGIGVAKGFVHVDTRDSMPVMWTY